ncbi:hypothetical protein AB0D99_25555 [Streptomyces sp. NPDC047971]|uniref:hypothetical protein n=1 Tax=Streptomyces sp. NPDC047971 TaxID=3154499 RepID=UPI0033F47ACA
MSEDRNTVIDPDDVFAATVPVDPPEERGRPGRARKLLTVVLPAVLVLGAVGGGVAYTSVTVGDADRSAPTVVWEQPDLSKAPKDPALGAARGKASTPLSKMQLPVPDAYELGPDIEGYGNDGELSGKEAAALLKEEGKGLAGKKRRDWEKEVDRQGIQGVAFRSYASPERGVVITVHITRMKDKKAIRGGYELKKRLMADLLKFPKGPRIDGHKNSACFMYPQAKGLDKEERAVQVDGMTCSAYEADVLVTVTAAGSKPFDKSEVAELARKQLDHITSPGEYI